MTEEEWLACRGPKPMVEFLNALVNNRRLRLWAVACCRQSWSGYPLPTDDWRAIDLAERSVDGALTSEEQAMQNGSSISTLSAPGGWGVVILSRYSWGHAFDLTEGWNKSERHESVVALLRDIFGNPFRPVAFSPSWRTDTAVSLARTMYDSREFSAMPILADALQDAGCDNEDVLNHCRDTNGTHVRGCWVVDLVLAKE